MEILKGEVFDERLFEKLFKMHFKGLCFFAFQYVKNHEASKEIVQDSFISLWENRENIDLSRSVKSYLTTTIVNKSLNYLRDNKKFDREILEFENLLPESVFQPNDQLVERELRSRIDAAIEELPEKCREIFKLSRIDQLKYQEIADRLSLSVKTVETQMSKALQHMRNRLSDYIHFALVIILIKNFY